MKGNPARRYIRGRASRLRPRWWQRPI